MFLLGDEATFATQVRRALLCLRQVVLTWSDASKQKALLALSTFRKHRLVSQNAFMHGVTRRRIGRIWHLWVSYARRRCRCRDKLQMHLNGKKRLILKQLVSIWARLVLSCCRCHFVALVLTVGRFVYPVDGSSTDFRADGPTF